MREALGGVSLAFVLIAATLGIVAWPTAQAGHFTGATGLTGCVAPNMADNNTHSFYYDGSLPQYMRTQVNAVRAESYDPTDINTVTSSNPNSQTDVVAYQQNYTTYCGIAWHGSGGSAVGHVRCVSLSGSACQKFEMRFDSSFTSSATTGMRKNLACHESGHTLGLGHRASIGNSCMWGAVVGSLQSIDQHDRDALNAHY